MKRAALLPAAVSLAGIALGPVAGVAEPSSASAPTDVNAWFATLTLNEVLPFVQHLPTWRAQGSSDPRALSFSTPAPTLGYSLPTYDLATGEVTGSTELEKALVPTGGYCARALINQRPIDLVVCAEPSTDGYQVAEASGAHLTQTTADLPSAGTTEPDHDFVGVMNGAVVPLNGAARSWLGAPKLSGSTFVRLVAEQKAEWDAVNRVNGPVVGGGIPLIGGDRSAVAAFETSVAKGLELPVSRLSHPWTVAEAEGPPTVAAHANTVYPGRWILLAGALAAVLAGTGVAASRRRRDTHHR